jgi:GNAT superfamily N-acetyltransferase
MTAARPPIEIRRATEDDVPGLVPLFGAYREFYHQRAEPRVEQDYLVERIVQEEAVVFLAERSTEAIGFTLLYPSFSSLSLRPIWVLNDLFVRPSERRNGVGALLLRRAVEFARARGAEYLTLETAKDNPAQRLYEAEGWRRDEEFLHYELRT